MVGNLKKITVFFKFPTVFLRKKEEEKGKKRKKVRVGEGKKLPSPTLTFTLTPVTPMNKWIEHKG